MSQKPKKQGIGQNKQFGPIQKLTVPDFQHISNQFEMMQNEVLEKPNKKKRQVKNFSIRKATNPAQLKGLRGSMDGQDSLKKGGFGTGTQSVGSAGGPREPSLLTEEEQEALKPQEVTVENPWIYEQTHQEYLDNIKGLPARHANVIKKHNDVQKETTFLHKVEAGIDKDQAAKDAIKLLEAEYEIFNEPNMPGVKVLTRYDTWDEDRSIEQWIEYCQARPGNAHALSPVYQGYEYCWKPVEVLDYDYNERRYKVRVLSTGQEKLVTRLSLLFFDEDPDKFKERVNQCKQRQEIVEAELRFTNIVDSVPTDSVSTLSKERRFYFLSKSVRESDKFDPDKIYATFKNLLRVVEEEYIRQMKKCVILKEMEDPSNYAKFQRLKIPVRLCKKTSPYFGVVRCPKYNFGYNYEEIQNQHFSSDEDLVAMTRIFIQKCIDFHEQRFMNTNKNVLKLPRELDDLEKIQKSHHAAVSQNMMIQWRDFLIGEIQDKLRKNHNFFEGEDMVYEMSPLKRIISRFEYILNTYLREFVQISINDWVDFIKQFTNPNLSNDELWRVNECPFVTIHLSVKKKARGKGKDKKKKKVEEVEGEAVEEESDEEDKNRVVYKPALTDCRQFILGSMDMIISSTNLVNNLESDLMPFLQKEGKANFLIDKNFEWIANALTKLNTMIDQNLKGPETLLAEFKKYEQILNVSKSALIDDLFKGGEDGKKKTLEEIRDQAQHYHQAYYDIMTLKEDVVNFKIYRVVTKKMKEELGDQALKIKESILDATYAYCNESVAEVNKIYMEMQEKISHDPQNEKELIATKDFIDIAPGMVEKNCDVLKEVYRHLEMLETFSYMYKEMEIESFWYMKVWPMKIQVSIQDGKNMIGEKNETFGNRLETEKDAFNKLVAGHQQQFTKVKEFQNLDQVDKFFMDSFNLKRQLEHGNNTVRQFHEREDLFGLPRTPYPDLDDIQQNFKPFFDLISMAHDVQNLIQEWTVDRLAGRNPKEMQEKVDGWITQCQQLYKKLNEDYPETSEVCNELKNNIVKFSKNLPLIKCFTSEAIMDEDWKEIQEVVGVQPFEREEIKVSMFEEYNLYEHIEAIEDIANRAAKKFTLAQNLRKMKDEMRQLQIKQASYKGTFLVKGIDEINAQLDDQIVATQAMMGSSFMRGRLKTDTKHWDTKLNFISELMEQVMMVQRTWMYLEPIFSSGDIANTMPLEGQMFNQVDERWRSTMKLIEDDPSITELAERELIMIQFQQCNRNLEKIQKSLSDYLEQKRLVFARFFFLANEDLLQILAQTKNPKLVQAHMDKCFEGISKVLFDEKLCVCGMISAEAEEVDFLKKIDVNEGDRKGNVEKWMLDIEDQMIKTLRELTKNAIAEYANNERTEWSKMFPGQVVLAASQIYWTKEVEQALNDNDVENYIQLLYSQIEDIVQMVRKPLKKNERITLKALVVIDVHAKDVVQLLIDKNIQSTADFDWSSQLRYYWEAKDTLIVKMVTAEIPYAYEYLGNSPRLVITALTDRCYRTLLGAKFLNYGGAPEGPAGTGKTESVKDLAKAIAVQCVVFNCSDGLDYLAMAKFFKGLAASGAWCCFDEFNRIDLEVLSVIAQQIQVIQFAIKQNKKVFEFEKTELKLNKACAVNITMNPGYAGRSELPDNLKALFRPVAMMVPDYAVIAQIELYSFGFSEAAPLSVKVVASLRLSSEQLSSQDHYDFGMRAVKSILTACGNQRQLLPDWPEDFICLKALKDVNCPKFTSNDIPLFYGITSDLFPGVKLPDQDYSLLIGEMTKSCEGQNIQPKQVFLDKCIQLYETIMVRHGLMVVGDPYAGKSCVIQTLREAMGNIQDDPKFEGKVETHYVNPKSITQNQLYGVFDMDTQEWSDGVLAIKIRDCAESETIDRKWVIFDGPVDAVWIENMNTVLDDNKKLCLNSGQIIKLKPTMTIMFEVDDLSHASPATVSRCGMVLLEAQQLGHNVFITSYINYLKTFLEEKHCDKLQNYFNYMADTCIEFTRKNCKFPCPGSGAFVVNHTIKYMDCYLDEFKPTEEERKESEENGTSFDQPKDIEDKMLNSLVYGLIWGIGGCTEELTRGKFDAFFKELLAGEDVITTHALDLGDDKQGIYEPMKINVKLGDVQSVFDAYYDQEEMRWVPWGSTVPKYEINKEDTYLQLSIPTIDSIRMKNLAITLLKHKKHCMFVGPTGTGKSVQINSMLKEDFDNQTWTHFVLGFSAQTTANQTERIIDLSMEKRRKGVYGPMLGKEGVIFVDDLSMPQKGTYGAQPPIELLRQWMDYQGWYDIDLPTRDFRKLTSVRFITAMGPPGNGRNSISNRYTRHFNVLYVEPYNDDSLKGIFSTIMSWLFQSKATPPFPQPVQQMKDSIVASTIIVYQETMKKFRPTPAKSHYSYNLRDVSKVFQGISKSSAKAITKEDDMVKLWAHECLRVFQDRLISLEDRASFQTMLNEIMETNFKKKFDALVKVQPLLFASFVPLCFPGGDTSKKPFQDVYCELYDREKMKKVCNENLEDYNSINHSKRMNLVLFADAIEHSVKIHRIITTEFGHALLIGVGGSGRKSLTELSIFIATFDSFSIEISSAYNLISWRDDMKKLFMDCGVDQKQTVFLLNDTQIVMESFLEDVNNILNNGEIPNLYSTLEDKTLVLDNMREANKNDKEFKNFSDNEIYIDFFTKCKNNIHICMAFSPIGDDIKRRLRMFPSLVNCCAIDWFLAWPQQALQSVAEHFLTSIDDLPEIEGIVQICVDMQMRVTNLAERYKNEQKRHYYVTPTSYLVLIQSFKELLDNKRNHIDSIINKYDRGITQLANANKEVGILQKQLELLMPKLEQAKKDVAVKIIDVDKQKKEVGEITKTVEAEEAVAKEEKAKADAIQKDCEFQLSRVMPIYNTAIRAVQQLKKGDIDEVKLMKTPPVACIAVIKTLCIMFDVAPKKVGQGKDKVEDYWTPAKESILNAKLLPRCQGYDKDNIDPKKIETLKPLIDAPEYEESKIENASKAAYGLSKWVKAMCQYDEAMKVVKPKQEELKVAKELAASAQAKWDAALEKLRAVEAQMKQLMDEFDAAKAHEQKLTDEFEDADRKCKRAVSLIEKLSNEEVNWKTSLTKSRADKLNVVGDIIISSGVIAYLGVFTADYRKSALESWLSIMNEYHIKSTDNYSLREVLGNGVKIQQWFIDELPQEDFAVENAIIMDNSDRWPLMIDPQMQGNNWIRCMEKDINKVKPTMDSKAITRVLKNCITLGWPLLLEDSEETFDPMIEPLLGKVIEKKGNMWTIKLGDEQIEYSKDFKFYVTTKLSKPHFAPEVCVKVTMLNFMVTEDGLLDQMLNIVVTNEDPVKMKQRNDAIIRRAANEKKMRELEDRILNQISNSEVDILEDDILVEILDEAKALYKQIEISMNESQAIINHINGVREQFEVVAKRVSRMFFVLIQLMNVDPMYQYSLKFFKNIYQRALNNAGPPAAGKRNERKLFFIKEFTRLLYENICRSLFEKDKLLFSMLMCLMIMAEEEGRLDQREVRFLMTGSTSVDMERPNPSGEDGWMSDKIWASILQVSRDFEAFKGLDTNFEKNLDEWERIYNLQKPQSKKANWPAPFAGMPLIRQAMFLRLFRPDKVIPVIQKLIKKDKDLGPQYIIPPPFDMEKSFEDSTNKIPIIIVLSAGADPMSELQKLAAVMNSRVVGISLGQGQAQIAIDAIKAAQEKQEWVCLQNCHLCPSFLPTLDGIIEEVQPDTQSRFRMWLTSMPSDKFPVNILQNGVKATIEPPKGLKNNILRSYLGIDKTEFESCDKPTAYKALMWGLCFFNALILERRKFGPLGWNIQYEFSNSDLSISQMQLMVFLNHYEQIPWEALRYMVAEANYGGRVTDPNDRTCISIVLEDFYCPSMLKDKHKLVESGKYIVPAEGDLTSYQDYIRNEMPLNDLTEIFGLHDNAEITSAINLTNEMMETALSLQGTESSGGGGEGGLSMDDIIQNSATDILTRMPKAYDMEAAAKKHPIKYEDSMNTVLQQELMRYNRLIDVIRVSLVNVGKAINGEVPLSVELEQVYSSLYNNQVPGVWAKRAYPSLKPLASWVLECLERLKFMQKWVDEGAPPNFWISGFFFTQSFLTGAKQNYARKHIVAIDQIDFGFTVISDESKYSFTQAPDDGVYVYGLFVEGCRWDDRKEALDESAPKVLFTPMKYIWVLPSKQDEIDNGHSYKCPVYKTAMRKGTLSTTGHSTNFVLYLYLPMQKKHTIRHWVKRGVALLTSLSD